MVDDERVPDQDALPEGEATLGTAFNKMRVIRQACLDKCEVMSCGTYEFSEPMRRSDWILVVIIAVVFGAMTFLGYLV
jgi:hypothetical protein